MRPTIRFGRIFGIEVGANWSVLLIAALLSFELTRGGGGASVWLVVVPMVLVFLGSLLAHELAHAVIARRNDMEVRGITLWLLGGVAQLGGAMPSAGAEFRIAVAGPATSYGLAGVFVVLALGAGAVGVAPLVVSALGWLAFVNIVLGTFNLIPAAPLDGGRILASALWAIHGDRTRADIAATRVGQAFGILAIATGVLGPAIGIPYVSLWTALMGAFVYRTATAEQRIARLVGNFADLQVRDIMIPDPETVRGWNTIQAVAADLALTPPRHHVLPVVAWEGGIGGVVTLEQLERSDPATRHSVRVQDIAVPLDRVVAARPETPVLAVAGRLGEGPLPVVLVFDDSVLVGMITPVELRGSARGAPASDRRDGAGAPTPVL
ncbi:MAG: site-2 protease family protein [Acidimicrobiia bacterium]|nr:site-2 protease family protein [Acidimicrobiia bacterium]